MWHSCCGACLRPAGRLKTSSSIDDVLGSGPEQSAGVNVTSSCHRRCLQTRRTSFPQQWASQAQQQPGMTAGLAGNPFATVSASAAAGPQASFGATDDPAAALLPRPVSAGAGAYCRAPAKSQRRRNPVFECTESA